MIRKVFRQQIVEVLAVAHAARGAVSADEPAFSCDPAPTVELERQEILESLVDLLPGCERLPTDDEVRVRRIETCCFQSPTFFFGDLMRHREDLFLKRMVKRH